MTPEGSLDNAWVKVEDGRIAAIGKGGTPLGTVDLRAERPLPGS